MSELVTTAVSAETTEQVVDFLSKGYTDEDCLHILPQLDSQLLREIKATNTDQILRGMRDYYLVTRYNDDAMDRIEAAVLEKLELSIAIEMNPTVLLKIFQTVNAAKRRSLGEGQVAGNTTIIKKQEVVNIVMPARMLSHNSQDFETNSNNEVIRVGKTHMVTATNTQVLAQLKAYKQSALEEACDGV